MPRAQPGLLAVLDRLGLLVRLELLASPDQPEPRVRRVQQAPPARPESQVQRVLPAQLVLRDRQARLVRAGFVAQLEQQVQQDRPEPQVRKVHLVRRDQKGQPGLPDHRDRPGLQVQQV